MLYLFPNQNKRKKSMLTILVHWILPLFSWNSLLWQQSSQAWNAASVSDTMSPVWSQVISLHQENIFHLDVQHNVCVKTVTGFHAAIGHSGAGILSEIPARPGKLFGCTWFHRKSWIHLGTDSCCFYLALNFMCLMKEINSNTLYSSSLITHFALPAACELQRDYR